jgi:phosphate-selective porin
MSEVDADDDVFGMGRRAFAISDTATTNAEAYTAGVNWYLTRNFKLQMNYERTEFEPPIEFGERVRDHEDVLLWRFQVAF